MAVPPSGISRSLPSPEHPRGFANLCAVSRAPPSHPGVASCERPRRDSFSPSHPSPARCLWQRWQLVGNARGLFASQLSASFRCCSADLHLPVVSVLCLHAEFPPAQRSAFCSVCKARSTRTLVCSRH